MQKIRSYILFSIIVLSFSCKKKDYPSSSIEGQPVFGLNATIDGEAVSITAGVNKYYMYSSYKQDTTKVYSFIADLKRSDCEGNCSNSLQIKINDFRVSTNSTIKIDSALATHFYPFTAGPDGYFVQFQSSYNKTAVKYLWDFGDGITSNAKNPSHVYTKTGRYNVRLSVNGVNSCYGTIFNTEKAVPTSSACFASISESTVSGNVISFSSNVQGGGGYSYLWNFGDGSTSLSANPTHTYTYGGSYPVLLRVIDSNNDTGFVRHNSVTQGDISSCVTNYDVITRAQIPNTKALSNIVVTWIDSDGTVYTSNSGLQPTSSSFEIVSVENFDRNENDEVTKKLHVKFKCTVFNGTNSKVINNADAVISVSYK